MTLAVSDITVPTHSITSLKSVPSTYFIHSYPMFDFWRRWKIQDTISDVPVENVYRLNISTDEEVEKTIREHITLFTNIRQTYVSDENGKKYAFVYTFCDRVPSIVYNFFTKYSSFFESLIKVGRHVGCHVILSIDIAYTEHYIRFDMKNFLPPILRNQIMMAKPPTREQMKAAMDVFSYYNSCS